MNILQRRGLTWTSFFRILLFNLKKGGLTTTLRKIAAQLRRTEIDFDIERYTKWLEKTDCADLSPANTLFIEPRVVIVGSLDLPQCKKIQSVTKG